MKNYIRILIAILVIASMILPRAADLNTFTAADEPFWLVVGANYYYALTHREFENTVYEYHPAVTTMWIGTAAMLAYFPEYRAIMHGYFQQEKTSFDEYLVEHGRDPLVLLWWARLFQLLLNVFLFAVAFLLLRAMLDEWTALAAVLLASFAPYLFGQSRMLNHESMVGLFSLIAILALTAYLFLKPHPLFLIVSGAAAAYANLTKSSSIVLFAVIAVMVFTWAVGQWRAHRRFSTALIDFLKTYGAWAAVFVITYFISWPGMWVAPGRMLYEVYGNAFSYAFQGARLSVTQDLQPSSFSLATTGMGLFGFLQSIAWRTTPVTWLGLILVILLAFQTERETFPRLGRYVVAFLLLEAFACIGMFSIIQGRDQPHYVLAAYYSVEFCAALGWVYGIRWLARSFAWAGRAAVQSALFAVLLIAQMYPLFYTGPYFYTYLNPLLLASSAPPGFFYGERMEEAAFYLAQKPDAENQTALVYFGRSFSYYYPGTTLLFKPILFEDRAQLLNELERSDYLVVYSGLHQRLPLLDEWTPEYVIDLNGRPYVEIYRLQDIPSDF
jgi:4-amino-4-deoxy-L-arabinose transferase-like glycosyltransferase